jgi:hypothetical protein
MWKFKNYEILNGLFILLFTACTSEQNKTLEQHKASEQNKEPEQIRIPNQVLFFRESIWEAYKRKSPCEKLKILSEGTQGQEHFILDSILKDMYQLTGLPANVMYGTVGVYYPSAEAYTDDLKKWKEHLKCK